MSELKLNIIKLRNEGFTYKQIKKSLNCSLSTISWHCRKENLQDSNKFKRISIEEIDKINNLYDLGLTVKDIAQKLNRDKGHIYRFIKNKRIARSNKSKDVIDWRKRTKLKLIEYKGGKCEICGYNKCEAVLQFHHINPKEKDFSISGKSWSFEKLKQEVDKCMLLCANCHTEKHYQERQK